MALQPFVLAQVRAEWLALKNEEVAPELKKFKFEMERIRPLLLELHKEVPQWWYGRLVSQDVFRTLLEKGEMIMEIPFGVGLDLKDWNQACGNCAELQRNLQNQFNVQWWTKQTLKCCIVVTLTIATKH